MSTCEPITQHVITGRLTARQAEVLEFITTAIECGCPPTLRDIAAHFGFSNQSGAVCHAQALEKKGFIRIERKISRGIRLVNIGLPGSGEAVITPDS